MQLNLHLLAEYLVSNLACAAEQCAMQLVLGLPSIVSLPHRIFSSLCRSPVRTNVQRRTQLHRGEPRRRRGPRLPSGEHRGRVPVAERRQGEFSACAISNLAPS